MSLTQKSTRKQKPDINQKIFQIKKIKLKEIYKINQPYTNKIKMKCKPKKTKINQNLK